MKLSKDYFPGGDDSLVIWNTNYHEVIPVYGQALGLTPEELLEQEDAALSIINSVNNSELQRNQAQEASAFKRQMVKEKGSIIRKCVARLKTHPAYTENIGRELGIIGLSQTIDTSKARPELKLTVYPGYVSVAFTKQGLQGVVIFGRIKGTLGWDKLGTDFSSPFLDKRPLVTPNQPEIREYMAMFANLREPIGQQSDIVTTVFGG